MSNIATILARRGSSYIIVDPNQTVLKALQLMADHNVCYLPVMEQSEMIGLISTTDLIREQVLEQKKVIRYLKGYMQG